MDNDLWGSLDAAGKALVLAAGATGATALLWSRLKKVCAWFSKKGSQFVWVFSEKHDHAVIHDQLELLAAGISDIKNEFKPNGGGSQTDKLDKLLEMAEFQKSFFHATLETHNTAVFRTDESGGIVWVNRTFCRLMGVTPAEVMQFGWVNIIDDEHEEGYRDKVVTMWLHAVKNKREFNETIYYKATNGKRFAAHAVAFVISANYGMFGHFGEIVPQEKPDG